MREKVVSVGKRMLADIIHHRSDGFTISQTAYYLGIKPWTVAYLTRFIRVCVTHDEYKYLVDMAAKHNFQSVGEFVMDVFNRSYEDFYVNATKRPRKKKANLAAIA